MFVFTLFGVCSAELEEMKSFSLFSIMNFSKVSSFSLALFKSQWIFSHFLSHLPKKLFHMQIFQRKSNIFVEAITYLFIGKPQNLSIEERFIVTQKGFSNETKSVSKDQRVLALSEFDMKVECHEVAFHKLSSSRHQYQIKTCCGRLLKKWPKNPLSFWVKIQNSVQDNEPSWTSYQSFSSHF